MASVESEVVVDRRRNARRAATRRDKVEQVDVEVEQEQRDDEPRRKNERRRQIDPTTCERDYSGLEVEFMRAMDDYKRRSNRPFPTWSEVLEVLHCIGYRKVAEPIDVMSHAQMRSTK